MSALTSYFTKASPTEAERAAVEAGLVTRRLYEDWKNADVDAFALQLAAEKRAKVSLSTVEPSDNIKVSGIRGSVGRRGVMRGKGKKGDLAYQPLSPFVVPMKWPAASNQKVQITLRAQGTLTTTSTTGITESNFSFALNNFSQYTSFVSVFDQYFVYSAEVELMWNLPPGGTAAFGQVYSALDFDNTASLGSVNALLGYKSAKKQDIRPGSVTRRSCCPDNATSVGPSTLAGEGRQWLDCSYPAIPYYGIRFIVDKTGAALTFQPVLTINVYFMMVI